MTSVVEICNLALSNIGKENINALDDGSPQAHACQQFYALTRDALLTVYPWRFAEKTASLAEIVNPKLGRWRYAYSRPNDCLRVRWLRPQYSSGDQLLVDELGHAYEIEGAAVYCDLSPALLRYTARIEDPTRFGPLFVDALATALAVRLAMPLTRDPKVRADAYQLAMRLRADAEVADANEQCATSDHASEMIEARG